MATVRCVGVIRYTREANNLCYGHVPMQATEVQLAETRAACRAQLDHAFPPIVAGKEKEFDTTHDDRYSLHCVNHTVSGALACRVVPG